jgi:hypothetical protein
MGMERADSYEDVEVDRLVRVLRGYGFLTGDRLYELSGAPEWPPDEYKIAVRRGVEADRIRELEGDFYELGEAERGP